MLKVFRVAGAISVAVGLALSMFIDFGGETAKTPVVAASPTTVVPMVKYPVQHAFDTRDELVEGRYTPGPIDYTTITGEVVVAIRWADPSETNDYVDFIVNTSGLPFAMTDGYTRCEFVPGTPETIFNLRTAWLLIGNPVYSGVEKRPIINTVNQEIVFTCAAV